MRAQRSLASTLALAVLALTSPAKCDVPSAAVYNITLTTDSAPDLTDIDSYLRSITSQYATPQEQAVAIWRWSQRLRKQTTNPAEDGHEVLDPIQFFNSYGYCNCGIVSGLNNSLWLKMGWRAHYVQLGDHTVCECSWDGGKTWHMFDASMSFYCFNEKGEVASVREIENNPRLYLENFAPECGTNPVTGIDDHRGWRCASDMPVQHKRTLANGVDSFKAPNSITDGNLYAQWGRRYVLNLRPGEHYTRYFRPLEGGGPGTFRPVRGNQDVDTQQYVRGNGVWYYRPDLCNPATRDLVYSDEGVKWTNRGVQGPGHVVFKVAAANVVTSAKVAAFAPNAKVAISRNAGINWQPIALTNSTAQCIDEVAGVNEYLVKVELGPDAVLSSLLIATTTQLNRHALPRLMRGPNRVQLRLGPQVETIQFQPSIVAGNHKKTVFAEQLIDVERETGYYKPTLRPAEKGVLCYVTWKIAAPTPITDLVYGGTVCVKTPKDRVTLLHSWDDKEYVQDYQKADSSPPFDLPVNAAVTTVPAGARTAYLRYQFETANYPKSYSGPGIQMAAMTVHHRPRTSGKTGTGSASESGNTKTTHPDAVPVPVLPAPIEVTYCWIEHRDSGDVERQHTELIAKPEHEYSINVGGFRDPTMKWVRVNLKGSGPTAAKVKYGYSDGQDVGPGAKAPWIRYRWGNNLALGKKYTLEGKQDDRNPDGGGDLTDGIIAPPDTYVSQKYMPTYVMFAKDVSSTAVIDLGGAKTVAAVRVHTGQEGGFHISHPDSIAVETSVDGKTFTPAGSAGFKQVFEPPADYVPWELDQSLRFADLPAGGRLAYAYRIIFERPVSARYVRVRCTGRKGWGMLLSEIQVFDAVTVDKKVPPPVVLPALQP